MLRVRTCHHCKTKYQPKRKDQKFCSSQCKKEQLSLKQKKATQRKIERRVSRLRRTGFGLYLVREVVRAKTVQILSYHTPDTLHELDRLRTECFTSNGVSLDGSLNKCYELSHICPVNSKGLVGLLHPHNLVISSKAYNRGRGTNYSGGGKFINRLDLKTEWYVDDQTPVSKVYDKIERFLGQVLKDYLTEHSPKLSYKERLVNKIIRHSLKDQEFSSKEAKKQWEDRTRRILNHLPFEQLEAQVLERDLSLSTFNRSTTRYLPLMLHEVKRFESYGVKVDGPMLAYAQYLTEVESPFFEHTERLQIESNDYQENEWVQPSIQYWFAQQLCKMLHKEAPDRIFNSKPYAQCFTLPKEVHQGWKPEYNVEEWQVAQHGMPAIKPKVVYRYEPTNFDPTPAAFEVEGYVGNADLSIKQPTQAYFDKCPF